MEHETPSRTPAGIAAILGGAGLTMFGISRRSRAGLLLAVVGGSVLAKALGNGAREIDAGGVIIERSITVQKPIANVYDAWRNLENLPHFMRHLESVSVESRTRSHWVARAPFGRTVSWDAEIVEDQPNALLSWHSVGATAVPNKGSVRFSEAPAGHGTVVAVSLRYSPTAGTPGRLLARLTGKEPGQQVEGDLHRFRAMLEAGETPSTTGQAAGERSPIGSLANRWAVTR